MVLIRQAWTGGVGGGGAPLIYREVQTKKARVGTTTHGRQVIRPEERQGRSKNLAGDGWVMDVSRCLEHTHGDTH